MTLALIARKSKNVTDDSSKVAGEIIRKGGKAHVEY